MESRRETSDVLRPVRDEVGGGAAVLSFVREGGGDGCADAGEGPDRGACPAARDPVAGERGDSPDSGFLSDDVLPSGDGDLPAGRSAIFAGPAAHDRDVPDGAGGARDTGRVGVAGTAALGSDPGDRAGVLQPD